MGAFALLLALQCAAGAADTKSLPTLAVLPLDGRKVDSLDARTLTDALADQLLKTRTVRVMERSQMDAVLKEQGFQQSGACDGQECAVQIGRILGIERIVVGSVASFGKAYTIAVREVDVQTGEVLATASRNHRGEFEDLLTDVVPRIAVELARSGQGGVPEADPVPAAPVAKATPPEPAPAAPVEPVPARAEKKRSGTWGWWVAGGCAAAGGAAAAIVLMNGGHSSQTVANDPTWKTKVEW